MFVGRRGTREKKESKSTNPCQVLVLICAGQLCCVIGPPFQTFFFCHYVYTSVLSIFCEVKKNKIKKLSFFKKHQKYFPSVCTNSIHWSTSNLIPCCHFSIINYKKDKTISGNELHHLNANSDTIYI